MPASFEPWVVMVLPPGGFFMIAALLLVVNWHDLRKARHAEPAPSARRAA
jgi:electron transport complex protein RnfE